MSESASHVGLAVNVGLLLGLVLVITVMMRYAGAALMQVFSIYFFINVRTHTQHIACALARRSGRIDAREGALQEGHHQQVPRVDQSFVWRPEARRLLGSGSRTV